MTADGLRDLVTSRRILVCLGPGGVGKTTSSAALGVAGALHGRRTLVLTIDPARRLANALGLDSMSNDVRRIDHAWWAASGLTPTGTLDALMIDTKRASDHIVEKYAPNEDVRRRVMENRLYDVVSTALAGSHDYMAMERLYELHSGGDWDLIVLDTPPSVHALDFLEAPGRLLDGMNVAGMEGLLRPLSAVGRSGAGLFSAALKVVVSGLSRFTGTDLLRDLSSFLLAFSEMMAGFRERAEAVQKVLAAPETGFIVVTAPNSLAVTESLHLRRLLSDRKLPFGAFVMNRFHPPPGDLPDRAAWPSAQTLASTVDGLSEPLAGYLLTVLEQASVQAQRDARARQLLAGPADAQHLVVTVPELGDDVHDLDGLAQVARAMSALP